MSNYDSTIEELINAVQTFFSRYIGGYITAVNAKQADGIKLKVLREVEVSDQDPYGAGKYPRVQLYVENIEFEQISSGYVQAAMTMVALVAINDSSDQRTKLVRYTEAARQALRDYHDLGVSEFDVDPRGMTVAYFPTDPDVGVGVATMRFRVMTDIPG